MNQTVTKQTQTPDVLMLLATGCSHCPAVLNSLTELLKNGDIGRLEIVNISQQPEIARQYNTRSVPWVKIGDIELSGAQSLAELKQAIEQSSSSNGLHEHYDQLLNNGQLQQVIEHIRKKPSRLAVLTDLMRENEIKISVQIGIGAVMEEFAESKALIKLIPELTELTTHPLARVRNDACFYLSLTAAPEVKQILTALLNDSDKEVQETAKDCLEEF